MTAAQRVRLLDIARDITLAAKHPSPYIRESVKEFTEPELEKAATLMGRIIDQEDGYQAFRLIRQWHVEGVKGVLNHLKSNNQI